MTARASLAAFGGEVMTVTDDLELQRLLREAHDEAAAVADLRGQPATAAPCARRADRAGRAARRAAPRGAAYAPRRPGRGAGMTATATRSVGVDELRRAWLAVQDGRFRATRTTAREAHPDDRQAWRPAEVVLPIVGSVPQAGATTLALAVATVAAPARVVEYAMPTASGLAAAATAELGSTDAGWTVGRRDQVHLARAGGHHSAVNELPPPDAAPDGTSLTVLDVGDHLGRLGGSSAVWLSASLNAAPQVVLVTARRARRSAAGPGVE